LHTLTFFATRISSELKKDDIECLTYLNDTDIWKVDSEGDVDFRTPKDNIGFIQNTEWHCVTVETVEDIVARAEIMRLLERSNGTSTIDWFKNYVRVLPSETEIIF